jgi:hypothetical protein
MNKGSRMFLAILKSIAAMACLFAIGYVGYHYPDLMIYIVSIGVACAFSWYFYVREEE